MVSEPWLPMTPVASSLLFLPDHSKLGKQLSNHHNLASSDSLNSSHLPSCYEAEINSLSDSIPVQKDKERRMETLQIICIQTHSCGKTEMLKCQGGRQIKIANHGSGVWSGCLWDVFLGRSFREAWIRAWMCSRHYISHLGCEHLTIDPPRPLWEAGGNSWG